MDRRTARAADDVIWPTRNGAFEPFVAQIALSDLSPLIWGGCFRDADVAGSSLVVFEHTVLRLNSAGQPRPLPDDMTPVGLRDITIAERLQVLGAERPFAAPRWFLTPCDDASGVLCPVGMLASYQDLFAEAGLQDLRFQPFDWVTARCLIDDLRANLERMVAGLSEDSIQDRSSDIPERRNATREMMADLNYLEGQIEARALDHAYSDSDRAWLMGQLDPMTNTAWISGNAEENGVKPRKLLELPIFTPYLKLFEFHARQVYCDDPQNLPFEARRMLERHWGQQARHERIYAGNSREDADLPVQDPVVLITQSPVLVSSDVGRTGRRAWHLDEDAARNGLFDRVAAIDIPMDKTDQTRSNNTDPTE